MKRVLVVLLVSCISWGFAATFTVNNTGDVADANPGNGVCSTSTAGVCTLRAAVQEANAFAGADTIVFSLAANSTITLTTGTSDSSTNNRRALPITESLTIDGSAVSGLTISGGWNGVASSTVGWGIFTAPTSTTAASRTINLNDLRLVNANPGSVSSGSNPGTANSNGGALFVEGGTVNISRVTFDNNTANDGSAFDLEIGTTVNVTSSTFSNGKSRDDGGAVDVSSGATANFTNTTFAYNRAQFGITTGTSGTGGAVRVDGTASFTYVTLAYNQGGAAGGLDVNGTTNLRNSLIFNNTVLDSTVNNCDAAVNNQGNNWTDVSGACGTLNTVTAANLKLSTTLATNTSTPANTGPTQTLALDSTSSVNGVIPAGTDCGAGVGATDQRGVTRAVGAGCEPGAYEVQSSAVTGTIFGDTNRNGTQDTGENALTAATVTVALTNTSTNATLTTTTATGAYSFSNVPVGTYSVTAAASGYSVTTAARTVTVASGTSPTVQAIGLAQPPAPVPCSTTYAGGFTTSPYSIFALNTDGTAGATLFNPTISGTAVQTTAFARDSVTNRLYYIRYETGTSAGVGYYDFATGQKVDTGLTIAKVSSDQGVANNNFTRFAFNKDGVGYASISATNSLYRITTNPFSATFVGNIPAPLPIGLSGDFAITAANRAWLSANGEVYRINLNDPNLPVVEVVNTNNATANGVAFTSSGNLLVSDQTTSREVNLATLEFGPSRAMTGQPNNSADLANCVVPALEPNISVVKTVSPTGSASPGSTLTYTITTANTGNAVSVTTTLQDSIPANTTYVPGSTTLNGVSVPDATGGVMPYVAARKIRSPDVGTKIYGDGIVATTGPAVVTFQVKINNPFPSTATAVANQGFVGYDSGVSETTITVPSAPTAGGSGATSTPVGNRDFGDAPDGATGTASGNYQTTGADNGPSHTIVSGLRLGSVVADADDGTLQNAAATADNLTGTNDEDGVTNFPAILASAATTQVITVPVGVTNTTGAAATLTGYLDFNKDGDFLDLGEQSASVSVAAGATSASVIFSAPAGLTAGTTYARFRIGSTASEVASSVGAASSGEVEDYLVTIGSPDLTISKTHIGSFVRGSTGTYTLTVRNTGDQPTAGTITVTDTLPAGLSVNNGSAGTVVTGGTNAANWTCTSNAASPQSITCTSTAVIATGGNSVFTLGVNVAAGAGTPVINNVAVSGGGEVAANNGNNTSSDSAVTAAPTDLTLTKSHSGSFTVGSTGTYNFTVNNIGGVASSGAITVTDTLPTGLTFVTGSTTGTGWSCSASGQTVTCISSTAVGAAGNSTFSFNVNVGAATAPGTNSITNTASVSGGGDSNPANNSANNGNGDPTTVLSPDLTVSKTHIGNFTRGSTGIYTITVGNSGTAPTSGTLTLTDTLPTGLSVNGGAAGAVTTGGTNAANWSCTANAASPQVITCSSTTSIAISGSSTFTLSVNVAAGAGSSVTNSVSVSGGNEATARNGNNSATDPTMTVAPTDLILSKTHSGNFTVGQPGSYSFTVTNSGGVASSGTITVTDTLPTGLTFVNGSATGAGWSCSASGQTVTCSSSAAISAAANSTFSFDVNVGVATAPGTNSITNTAAVSGGGDSNAANNGAADPTTVLSPDLTVSKSHTPASFVQGGVGNYLIRVYNNTNSSAAPTSGPVTVTDTLPNGLSVPTGAVTLTAGKTVWSCTAAGQTASGQVITCTYTKTVAAGSGSNVGFNVNVASPAPASVTNEVMVSGGNEATANTGNNTYSDPTPTVDAGSLTLVKSVRNVTKNSPFSSAGSGEPGDVLEYCIAYSNPGQSPVSVATIQDTVPTFTVVQTNVLGYGGAAIRWRVTLPSASTQNLSADADSDAGEISGNILTTRLDIVPAGGAGDVCFQAGIE